MTKRAVNYLRSRNIFSGSLVADNGLPEGYIRLSVLLEDYASQLMSGIVEKRLQWLEQRMEETPPFKQAYNNLNERRSKLLDAKSILEKEGL